MVETIPINTEELAVRILNQVSGMRKEKKHCDFVIKVGTKEIPVHRNILCATSEYFDKMFSNQMREAESGFVEMKDVDPDCAVICVDHMYGKEVSISPEKYEAPISVGNMMQLHTLCDAVTELMAAKLDVKSFFSSRRIADLYGCKSLEEECWKFAVKNFASIYQEKEFGKLGKNYVKKLIKSENMTLSESKKLEAVLIWIKCDSNRSESILEMLQWINLSEVPVGYCRYIIEKDPLIFGSPESMRLLCSSVMDTMHIKATRCEETEKGILVFDGISGYLQLWDPKANMWKKMQQMNDDMKSHCFSAVSMDEHIYVLMCNKSVYRLEYLNKRATWERMANMIDDHGLYPRATVFSSCIYVFGGDFNIASAVVEKYDPFENKWMKVGNKPQPSQYAEVLTCQKHVYSFGGLIDGQYSNKVLRFEPLSSTWSVLSPMKVAKVNVGAAEAHGKIYLLGAEENRSSRTVEVYDIQSDCWTTMKPMRVTRSWLGAFVIDRHMYAFGGYNSSPDSIERYKFENEDWEMVDLPSGMRLNIIESCEVSLER